ncbi:MAG: hypothetical protein AB1491_00840 [Thermodesulfobacteriota bacterium]
MRLLFYTSQGDRRMKWLEQRLTGFRPLNIEICRDLDTLEGGLRQLGGEMVLAVLLTISQEELQEVMTLKPWLQGKPLILILPDRNRDTIAKGHVLAPRYLAGLQDDFQEIYEVLNKMLEIYLRQDEGHGRRQVNGLAPYL